MYASSLPSPVETTASDYARAVQAHPDRARSVFHMVVDGRRVWVKRNRKHYGSNWQYLLHMLQGTTATPQERMERELTVMEHLRGLGSLVPELLYRAPDYVVLSDLGPSLHVLMQQNPPADEKRNLLHKAVDALRQLHRRDGWHGNPKLMDLTLHPAGVGFIDFEEATDSKLPIIWRQVRDLWLFAHSVVRFDPSGQLSADALEHYAMKPQLRLLRRVALYSLPLYVLCWPLQHWLGRDVRHALANTRAILGCKIGH